MNIYLDIDGVILANDQQPAKHVRQFLQYVTHTTPPTGLQPIARVIAATQYPF